MRNPTAQRRARALRNQATDAERTLWRFLRLRQLGGYRFRRQVPTGSYIVDFACLEAKLVIELDGGQHQEQQSHDWMRDRQIEAQGFCVMRFWDNELFRQTQAVLEQIMRVLEMNRPHSGPAALQVSRCPPQAGEGIGKTDRLPEAGEGTGKTDHPQHAGQITGEADLASLAGEGMKLSPDVGIQT